MNKPRILKRLSTSTSESVFKKMKNIALGTLSAMVLALLATPVAAQGVDLGPLEGMGVVCNGSPDAAKDISYDEQAWVAVGGDALNSRVSTFNNGNIIRFFLPDRIETEPVKNVVWLEGFLRIYVGDWYFVVNRTTLSWVTVIGGEAVNTQHCVLRTAEEIEEGLARALEVFKAGRQL